MSDWWVNFTANLVATLVGVFVALKIQPTPTPTVNNQNGTIAGDVVIEHNTHSDRRIHVEFNQAPRQPPPEGPAKPGTNGPDDLAIPVVAGAIAIIILAVGYLLVREVALTTFGLLSTFLMAFLLCAVLVSLRFAYFERSLLWRVAILPLVVVVTLVNRYWLVEPHYPSDRLRMFVESGTRLTFSNATEYLSFHELAFLALQGFGLLLTGAALLLVLFSCFGLVLQIRRAHRNGASHVSTGALSTKMIILACFFSLLALPLCRGWLAQVSANAGVPSAEQDAQIDASAKLSPRDSKSSLVCAKVTNIDVGNISLVLQAQVQSSGHREWRQVGDPLTMSSNGTVCRDIQPRKRWGPYRFLMSTDSGGAPVKSDAVDLTLAD